MDNSQLAIYYAEIHRREKNTGVAYLFLIFFGWWMVHQIYLGNIRRWYLSAMWPLVSAASLLVGMMVVEEHKDLGGLMALISVVSLVITCVIWFADACTLPRQVAERQRRIEARVKLDLGVRQPSRVRIPNRMEGPGVYWDSSAN